MSEPVERFPTTSWRVVLVAADETASGSQEALAQLYEAYWRPLYAYIRRYGRSAEDSRDLIQEFFCRMLEKHYLRAADRTRGRFRTFLLAALKHFLANEWDHAHTQKRGGDAVTLALDLETAEDLYRFEPADRLTPDKIFERSWARTLLERAMVRWRQEFLRTHRPEVFEAIRPFLTDGSAQGDYEQAAAGIEMSGGALKVAVHRARRRFAGLAREEIACTVDDPDEVDDEIRYLLSALSL